MSVGGLDGSGGGFHGLGAFLIQSPGGRTATDGLVAVYTSSGSLV
jgi:hypothetical protein